MTADVDHRERALGLFRFLRGMAELKHPPVRDLERYTADGEVQWFDQLPTHPDVRSVHRGDEVTEGVWVEVDKQDPLPPPEPPMDLAARVSLPGRSTSVEPKLLPDRDAPVRWDDERMEEVPEPDPLEPVFHDWLEQHWRPWQRERRRQEAVTDLYRRLFSVAERLEHQGDALEFLVALGCLSWHPEGHEPVRRHVVVVPAEVAFDERTGRLSVLPADDADPAIEVDMLDPGLRPDPARLDSLDTVLNDALAHVFDEPAIRPALKQAANILDASSHYSSDLSKPQIDIEPQIAYAPAMILRRRSAVDQVRLFDTILADLEGSAEVPAGIRQLVDETAGHVTDVEEPRFHLPLPANDEQLEIVRRVATRPFTVVQGPPGTGKTHTIANLLSHLLAHGKRVLVTAETDRALRELRDKLPEDLRTLCVSVVGSDRNDRNSLKVAIDTLASEAARFDPHLTNRTVTELRSRVDALETEREELLRRLVEIRGDETRHHEVAGYAGTPARIAATREARRERFEWIEQLAPDLSEPTPPVTAEELATLVSLWTDAQLTADETAARQVLPDASALPSPETFLEWVQQEAQASAHAAGVSQMAGHHAFTALSSIEADVRAQLAGQMDTIAKNARTLADRHEAWIGGAIEDILNGRPHEWRTRYQELSKYAADVTAALQQVPLHIRVDQDGTTPRGQLRRQAQTLGTHLAAGGKLKGFMGLTPGPVKESAALLQEVTVNDLPPDTSDACRLIDAWFDIAERLDAMDRLWPQSLTIPQEDTPHERLSWHRSEIDVLATALDLAQRITDTRQLLVARDVPQPAWRDLDAVARYAEVVSAADAVERHDNARAPLQGLADQLRRDGTAADASPLYGLALSAVEDRDPTAYARVRADAHHLRSQRARMEARDGLQARLERAVPSLADARAHGDTSGLLADHATTWEDAWSWARVAEWVADTVSSDAERIQERLSGVEREVERFNGELTAALAWLHAIERLDHRQQSNLRAYANAAGKIPKTRTAKTRPQRLRDAQDALRKCREAVPSWVMPLYRIAESMDIARDAFDVVIIDEASQADTGASFLQYLAPQVVVVGDDKQVSPTIVGIDDSNVQELRRTHLGTVPHEAVWSDANSSYFEICDVYFSDRVTLREHFRCMPEIIGFSNRVAYEPDNVSLIPLKQFGSDRLRPIRTQFVPDGWEERQRNRPEAVAVAELVEKLCADPRYDGRTIGVITLSGPNQHKLIDTELLARMQPEEYRARDLRCGTPPDFQGSERDIIVLSMVSAPKDSGRMPVARTTASALQRYNVAASRAKEQMWVVHSVQHTQLTNAEDLRYKLLSYCHEVMDAEGRAEEGLADPLPEHTLVEPFTEMFEQRVANRIIERGFRVQPQFDVYGHRLDLVVLGDGAKLAIECDGDRWEGPESFVEDLRVQQKLQRCGWPVLRVRESLFTVDPERALDPLWGMLDQRGIRPAAEGRAAVAPEPEHEDGAPTREAELVDARSGAGPVPVPPPPPSALLHTRGIEPLADPDPDTEAPLSASGEPAPLASPAREPTGHASRLAEYEEWQPTTQVREVHSATLDQLVDVLVDIVEVEGPIVGDRLYQLYVRASGGRRVGGEIRKQLNRAAARAERLGRLVGEDPLQVGGQKAKTYTVPGQSPTRVRALGPRGNLDHIPPREMSTLMSQLASRGLSGEELHRALLAEYGMRRYTTNVRELLTEVEGLDTGVG